MADVFVSYSGSDKAPADTKKRRPLWSTHCQARFARRSVAPKSLDDFARAGTIGTAWVFLWTSELAPFRDDSRFSALVERMKFPDYWNVYGPPDGCELRDGALVQR